MPRALAIRYLTVPDGERAAYVARLAERNASARAAGFHFWAFEQETQPGRFVEFVETASRAALETALLHDALLGEALDFRHAPADAEAEWQRFTGVADG